MLTGTFSERDEGLSSRKLGTDVSTYNLSKRLTYEFFRFHCQTEGFALGKFVLPNPFGAFEDPRFTAYLMKNWLTGRRPGCNTPHYIRDNMFGSLLALVYVRFLEQLSSDTQLTRLAPSGFVSSQGDFALKVASEMESRLGIPCPLDLAERHDFIEPRVRINTDRIDADSYGFNEAEAWDEMASYYKGQFS